MKIYRYILPITVLFAVSNLFAHSKAIHPGFVEELMQQYFEVQQALAVDDLEKTNDAATQYTKMLNLQPELSMKPSIIRIKRATGRIKKANDLGIARISFHELSTEMKSLVEDVGIKRKTLLYIVSCPVAFKITGGFWIQTDTTISNPYLGLSAPQCGKIERKIF